MKIIILQDYLRCGGTEKQSIFFFKHFNQIGYETYLITMRPNGPLSHEIKSEKLISLQLKDTKLDWYAPGLIKKINEILPDIILCMGRIANQYSNLIKYYFPKLHIVATLRTGKKLSYLYKRSLRISDSILVNCEWWKYHLIKKGFNANKITVILNPIVIEQFNLKSFNKEDVRKKFFASKETIIFICVQGFRKGKNHINLIKIFSKLNKEKDWQLWLIGEGEEKRNCEVLVKKLNLTNKIYFLGFQNNPEEFYKCSDIAVSASEEDSFPNFIIEAQYFGLPIIAIDIIGVRESFINEVSGFLIKKNDSTHFLEILNYFLNNKYRINEMGYEANKFSNQFFHPNVIKQQINEYFKSKILKPKSRIILLARWLTSGDGISGDLLGMYYTLLSNRYNVYLYAHKAHYSLKNESIKKFKNLKNLHLDKTDIIIYFFTSGWDEGIKYLNNINCIKILRYHNVTPPEFFKKYSESHYKRSLDGINFLPDLHKINWHKVFTPSLYSANHLINNKFNKNIIEKIITLNSADYLTNNNELSLTIKRSYDINQEINILSVGRISPNKNHVDLINAFAFYNKNYNSNSTLTIFGKQNRYLKKYTQELKTLCQKLNIDNKVYWINGGSDQLLFNQYKKAHIFAMTSKHEGLSIPLIEAMAAQIPIVSFSYAAVPETIGSAGIIVDSNNYQIMADKFNFIINDHNQRLKIIHAGYLRYKNNFSPSVVQSKFLDFISYIFKNR